MKEDDKSDKRIPPGQYVTKSFPIFSISLTPKIDIEQWTLRVHGEVDNELSLSFSELKSLDNTQITKDIHCVTNWSKLDTNWRGVAISTLLEMTGVKGSAKQILFHSADGYTTNLDLKETLENESWVVYEYEGGDIEAKHGGPVRALAPHLYFWKSAKWLTGIELVSEERLGTWEQTSYHHHGDPWKEERYKV